TPVAETPVAETPVAEPPVAETPVAETPVAETPVAETPVAETPVAETPVAETPVAETPVAETPVAETPVAEEDPLSQVPAELIQILEAQDGYIPTYFGGAKGSRTGIEESPEVNLGMRRRRDEDGNVLMGGVLPVPPKVTRYASLLIQRYDLNANSQLEPNEWKKMTGFQEAMDANQDQELTVDELADWLVRFGQDRSIRLSREGIGWKDEPLDTDSPLPSPTISDPIRLYDYSTASGVSSGTTAQTTNSDGTLDSVFMNEGYLSDLGVSPEFVDQPSDSQGFNFEVFSALPVSPGRGSGGGDGNPQRWGTRAGSRGGEASDGNPSGNMGGMFIVSDNNGNRGGPSMQPADRVAQVRKQMDDAVAAELITADQALTIVAMSAGRNLDELPPDLKAIREAPDFQERLANVFQRFMELRNDSSKSEILKQIFGDQNRFLGGRSMGRGMMGGMPGNMNGPGMMGGPGRGGPSMGPGGDGNQPAWGSSMPRNPWDQSNGSVGAGPNTGNGPMGGPGMGPMDGNQPSWSGANPTGGWGQPSGNMGNMPGNMGGMPANMGNNTGNMGPMGGNQPSWSGANPTGGWGQPGGNMGNMPGNMGGMPANMGNNAGNMGPMGSNQPSWSGANPTGDWGQPRGNMGNMPGNMGGMPDNMGNNTGNMGPMGGGGNQPGWGGANSTSGWGQPNMGGMPGNMPGGSNMGMGDRGGNGASGEESRSRRQRFSRTTMGGATAIDTRSDHSAAAMPPQMGGTSGNREGNGSMMRNNASGNTSDGDMSGGSYGNRGNRFQEIRRSNNLPSDNPSRNPENFNMGVDSRSGSSNPENSENSNESNSRRGRRSRSAS
ncbi:MAG: hypothetical protein PHE53_10410, partial [Thermoguttaceae bacterium]|nr:hypothetical protein [Thermoguttaceae bacterium]